MTTRMETDVLVVGGGGAGFRAAIGARQAGSKVLLLSKGPLARCGASPMAGADFTTDGRSLSQIGGFKGDPNDTPEKVLNDIVTQGCFLNNQKIVEQYIRRSPQCLRELIAWGIQIKMSDERMILTSGLGIMDALLKKAKSVEVGLLEDVFLLDLSVRDGRIAGALGLNIRTGEFIWFRCKALVMATGGWHKAFWPNTGMRDLSGEGIAMAHRAGAEIGNLEFVTFCCNVFLHPPIWRGSIAAYIISLVVGGILTNSKGEEFLKKYDPFLIQCASTSEWNKSVFSYATMREVREGNGSPHGGIYYSRGNVPWGGFEAFAPLEFPKWKYKAIDFTEWGRKLKENEPVEVGPAVEYFDGGIKINEHFETGIQGLFAAGECALGAFGSNRVFSAITEMLVQGADAGANAGAYAAKAQLMEFDEPLLKDLEKGAEVPLKKAKGARPAEVRRRVQEAANKHLGPIRTGNELRALIDSLQSVKTNELPKLACTSKSRIYNKEWVDALELKNIVALLEMAAQSALLRTESRGVHYREDYPDTDNDRWLKESIVRCTADGFEVTYTPVTVTSLTPPKGVMSYLDYIKKMMQSRSDTKGHH